MTKKLVAELQIGDVVLPPERELRLWMRRHCADHGWPETILRITITEAHDGTPDQRGAWRVIKGYLPDQWYAGSNRLCFMFKARPTTPWPVATEEAA